MWDFHFQVINIQESTYYNFKSRATSKIKAVKFNYKLKEYNVLQLSDISA